MPPDVDAFFDDDAVLRTTAHPRSSVLRSSLVHEFLVHELPPPARRLGHSDDAALHGPRGRHKITEQLRITTQSADSSVCRQFSQTSRRNPCTNRAAGRPTDCPKGSVTDTKIRTRHRRRKPILLRNSFARLRAGPEPHSEQVNGLLVRIQLQSGQ